MKASEGLTDEELEELDRISEGLATLTAGKSEVVDTVLHRQRFALCREAIHLFQDVIRRLNEAHEDLAGRGSETLVDLARTAMWELGGEAEPAANSLKDYDHKSHGPFLGVSDEGSAVHLIRRVALNSPKMTVLGAAPPIVVGVSHDAERLAAAGEVAVGPKEYADVRLGSAGSLLTSTNVGTRLNLKYYKLRPTIHIPRDGPTEEAFVDARRRAEESLLPFIRTPDRSPRPIAILARFEPGTRFTRRYEILRRLQDAFRNAEFSDPEIHHLGLLVETGRGGWGVKTAMRSIKMASEVGVTLVAFSGIVLSEAEDKISMPGLLQYFSPGVVSRMMEYAAERGVSIEPKNMLDPDTVARSVWATLQTARNMGLELGKYGLFPLTIMQADEVMGQVQAWFEKWTAAPAFYVDFPAIGREQVYGIQTIAEGLREWLEIVASHGIPVVLIDTADKDKGRRLMKESSSDRVGILEPGEIKDLNEFAARRGIRVLWAGGIKLRQVFQFGKLGVFGVYVTSSAASLVPATQGYERDPLIVAVKEPTREGVAAALLLLQSGFLVTRLRGYARAEDARELELAAESFVENLNPGHVGTRFDAHAARLISLAEEGWRYHYKSIGWPTHGVHD